MLVMDVYLSNDRTHIGKPTRYVVYRSDRDAVIIYDHYDFYADYNVAEQSATIGGSLSSGIYNSSSSTITMPASAGTEGKPKIAIDIYV